ncbi:hypothetical protein BLNAU_2918 [Blattamonas nauphoetae]|uniref:Uncharacterized protein n=1 Tax=Blattamonas nauphoetae TaxID=2049346 RepID=A0ABQ9YF00_9EUKA|nr:hypothetical protein BLNAU_2918 [Blattamonas nauphoetae]
MSESNSQTRRFFDIVDNDIVKDRSDLHPTLVTILSSLQDPSDKMVILQIQQLNRLILTHKAFISEPFLSLNGIDLLLHRVKDSDNSTLIQKTLITISNLSESSREVTRYLESSEIFTLISTYMTWNDPNITKECIFCLGNLAAESTFISHLIVRDTNLFSQLCTLLVTDDSSISELLFLFFNLTAHPEGFDPFLPLLPSLLGLFDKFCTEEWMDTIKTFPSTHGTNPLADCLITMTRILRSSPTQLPSLDSETVAKNLRLVITGSYPTSMVLNAIKLHFTVLFCCSADRESQTSQMYLTCGAHLLRPVIFHFQQSIARITTFLSGDEEYTERMFKEHMELVATAFQFFDEVCADESSRLELITQQVIPTFESFMSTANAKCLTSFYIFLESMGGTDPNTAVEIARQANIPSILKQFLTIDLPDLSVSRILMLFQSFSFAILASTHIEPDAPTSISSKFHQDITESDFVGELERLQPRVKRNTAQIIGIVLGQLQAWDETMRTISVK